MTHEKTTYNTENNTQQTKTTHNSKKTYNIQNNT